MQRDSIHSDRTLGELFADLAREMSTLLRQEVQLAKTELTHTASEVGKDVAFVAAGALVAYAGFLALLATLILALGAAGMPWWLAALIVTVIVLVIGGVLVMQGLDRLKRTPMAPVQTVETLKEDQQFIKEQMR